MHFEEFGKLKEIGMSETAKSQVRTRLVKRETDRQYRYKRPVLALAALAILLPCTILGIGALRSEFIYRRSNTAWWEWEDAAVVHNPIVLENGTIEYLARMGEGEEYTVYLLLNDVTVPLAEEPQSAYTFTALFADGMEIVIPCIGGYGVYEAKNESIEESGKISAEEGKTMEWSGKFSADAFPAESSFILRFDPTGETVPIEWEEPIDRTVQVSAEGIDIRAGQLTEQGSVLSYTVRLTEDWMKDWIRWDDPKLALMVNLSATDENGTKYYANPSGISPIAYMQSDRRRDNYAMLKQYTGERLTEITINQVLASFRLLPEATVQAIDLTAEECGRTFTLPSGESVGLLKTEMVGETLRLYTEVGEGSAVAWSVFDENGVLWETEKGKLENEYYVHELTPFADDEYTEMYTALLQDTANGSDTAIIWVDSVDFFSVAENMNGQIPSEE